jgi:hypothetical protein
MLSCRKTVEANNKKYNGLYIVSLFFLAPIAENCVVYFLNYFLNLRVHYRIRPADLCAPITLLIFDIYMGVHK